MSDALTDAINRSRAKASGLTTNITQSSANIAQPTQNLKQKLDNLPTETDPSLIKRQREAEALEIKAKISESQLITQDEVVEKIKSGIRGTISSRLSGMIRRPTLDSRILQSITVAKQLKKLYEQRNKISKENLKKGRELFSYPINKINPISLETLQEETPPPKKPTVPQIPFRRNR